MTPDRVHDVLVVGGGNAGIALAARLRRDGCRDVGLVEPSVTHRYRPLLSYVGSGAAALPELERPEVDVVPAGCTRYTDEVVAVDPDAAVVRLAGGGVLGYRDLVLCPGSQVDTGAVPGLARALDGDRAVTTYLPGSAARTWPLLAGLRSGTVVFAMWQWQVPCAPVALKPLFAAVDHWRSSGVRDAVDVHLLVETDALVPLPRAERRLRKALRQAGVRVHWGTQATLIDPSAHTLQTSTGDTLGYDALYLAPPHRAPGWVAEAGLAGSGGFLEVDPQTLQHPRYPRVWGLGDVADLGTVPSGGALRAQVPVVADNIARQRLAGGRLGPDAARYDGYTVAPVTTSRHRLLLAEFDRDGVQQSSVPGLDLARPLALTRFFDRYLQPQLYWRWLLRGH